MYVYLQLIKKGFYISYFSFPSSCPTLFSFSFFFNESRESMMRVCSMLPIVALATVLATISVSCTMAVSSGTSSEMQKLIVVLPTSLLDYHISSRNPAQKIAYLFRGQNGGQNGEITLAKVKLHYILLDKTATQIKRYYHIEIVC
jgi:hypothetical protein